MRSSTRLAGLRSSPDAKKCSRLQPGVLEEAKVAISAGFLIGYELNLVRQDGISSHFDAASGELTLSGRASTASYQAMLRSLTYRFAGSGTHNDGANSHRVVIWAVRNARRRIACGVEHHQYSRTSAVDDKRREQGFIHSRRHRRSD